jgi:hypothetical protein
MRIASYERSARTVFVNDIPSESFFTLSLLRRTHSRASTVHSRFFAGKSFSPPDENVFLEDRSFRPVIENADRFHRFRFFDEAVGRRVERMDAKGEETL